MRIEEITFSEIISYAKIAEDNAKQFYLSAAAQAKQSNVRELLEALAAQEQKHKDYLEELDAKIKAERHGSRTAREGSEPRLRQDDRAVQTLDADARLQGRHRSGHAVKEKEAIETYEHLMNYVDDPDAKKLFELLLEEERRHLSSSRKSTKTSRTS